MGILLASGVNSPIDAISSRLRVLSFRVNMVRPLQHLCLPAPRHIFRLSRLGHVSASAGAILYAIRRSPDVVDGYESLWVILGSSPHYSRNVLRSYRACAFTSDTSRPNTLASLRRLMLNISARTPCPFIRRYRSCAVSQVLYFLWVASIASRLYSFE
ncbi:hypothetical protein EDB85DRAFT_551309 [Lactarius pseudohatsudake]|nr:hypothetical protein EDB85DRAFT_551309 [Lactarius pseudohatsudake]